MDMSSCQNRHTPPPPLLLLPVLLLGCWTAGAAQDGSEAAAKSPVHITAREGSSMLVACDVSGGHDSIGWFNSKGALLGEDTGLALSTCTSL